MKYFSKKELRTSLPDIRKLIFQSKPKTKISLFNYEEDAYVTFAYIERVAIKDMGDDFLTRKEVDYYLSLPDYEAI